MLAKDVKNKEKKDLTEWKQTLEDKKIANDKNIPNINGF